MPACLLTHIRLTGQHTRVHVHAAVANQMPACANACLPAHAHTRLTGQHTCSSFTADRGTKHPGPACCCMQVAAASLPAARGRGAVGEAGRPQRHAAVRKQGVWLFDRCTPQHEHAESCCWLVLQDKLSAAVCGSSPRTPQCQYTAQEQLCLQQPARSEVLPSAS
jgi:hypothetical protein